ncbi:hypothetical protein [Thermomonas brevis]|nr:hypothetical protein [Thermomonas brevis]
MTGTMAMGSGRGNGLRPFVWGGAAGLLLLPVAAMRFFPEAGVDWSGADFAVMGALLAAACGLYELGAWLGATRAYRAGFGLAVLAGFLTVWANLAVGMLGDEGNPANLLFLGVLAVAALGSLLARFRPAGMAKAMFATAAAQLAAVGIALATGGFEARELALTACFALPWLLAGWLFRSAAR